ncbi:hypothetical protein BU16DRAFT_119464 [Lophium mytilinum]|uniref:Uncharacterized protein n=1 Tax=Lophium mytilinum TaxID=390894 RepID=A0A6A6QHH4_9PEZI|nr:hypothetical protein BU16DRAFT_119464 [Lophium mytilinum]
MPKFLKRASGVGNARLSPPIFFYSQVLFKHATIVANRTRTDKTMTGFPACCCPPPTVTQALQSLIPQVLSLRSQASDDALPPLSPSSRSTATLILVPSGSDERARLSSRTQLNPV